MIQPIEKAKAFPRDTSDKELKNKIYQESNNWIEKKNHRIIVEECEVIKMNKCSTSLIIKKCKSKPQWCHFPPVRTAVSKNTKHKCLQGCGVRQCLMEI